MSISWTVAEISRSPEVHAGGRVVVVGVLYLDEQLGFRIFHTTADGYDEHLALEIDDAVAATKLRDALAGTGGAPVYLGPGVIDGEARAEGGAIVVVRVVTVHLGDPLQGTRAVRAIEIRPNPWAR